MEAIEMPREFTRNPAMKQIRCVMKSEILWDTEIHFKSSGTTLQANRFLLCMSSEVLHKMICSPFSENMALRLELEDVDGRVYSDLLDLWCGNEGLGNKSLDDVMVMASVADRLEMTEVGMALEEAIIGHLSVDICGDMLMGSMRLGLGRVEAAARGLALDRFLDVAETEGFLRIDEEAMGSLLDDDSLCERSEKAVLQAAVRWMKGGGGELRGRGLLSKIRFCVMDLDYLFSLDVHRLLPAEHADWIEGLVYEAQRVDGACGRRELVGAWQLGEKAHVRRPWPGVRWERYGEGSERRLQGHTGDVSAIAVCQGRICSGSKDGSICVWDRKTLVNRVLQCEGETVDPVFSLASWEKHLISGHGSGVIRVWNVERGVCDRVLEGHTNSVNSLAVSRKRLASGSDDKSIKVWAIMKGPPASWSCEQTLIGHADGVIALATWRDKVMSGDWFGPDVRVWDMRTGSHDTSLTGHTNGVRALVVHGNRLFCASYAGDIREWALGTWAAMRTVQMECTLAYPSCLAVSGTKLICGSGDSDLDEEHCCFEVEVWDLRTLRCEHTLSQPKGSPVYCLATVDKHGMVWGGVGNEVVVWGSA